MVDCILVQHPGFPPSARTGLLLGNPLSVSVTVKSRPDCRVSQSGPRLPGLGDWLGDGPGTGTAQRGSALRLLPAFPGTGPLSRRARQAGSEARTASLVPGKKPATEESRADADSARRTAHLFQAEAETEILT